MLIKREIFLRLPTDQEVSRRRQIKTELQSTSVRQAMEENRTNYKNWLRRRNKEENRLKNYKKLLKLLLVAEELPESEEFIALTIQRMNKQEEDLQYIKSELNRIWKERTLIRQAGEME